MTLESSEIRLNLYCAGAIDVLIGYVGRFECFEDNQGESHLNIYSANIYIYMAFKCFYEVWMLYVIVHTGACISFGCS